MQRHERSAPIWLFSFVDLAFLLLIAFTQIGADDSTRGPTLARVEIPRLHGPGAPPDATVDGAGWQLRVTPATVATDTPHRPFALVEPRTNETFPEASIDAADLAVRLRVVATRGGERPTLLPHPDARAEDLLVAVDLIDAVWGRPANAWARPGSASPPSDPAEVAAR